MLVGPGVELRDGAVLFATGQGIGRTQLVRLDPSWLLLPLTKAADFTTALARHAHMRTRTCAHAHTHTHMRMRTQAARDALHERTLFSAGRGDVGPAVGVPLGRLRLQPARISLPVKRGAFCTVCSTKREISTLRSDVAAIGHSTILLSAPSGVVSRPHRALNQLLGVTL